MNKSGRTLEFIGAQRCLIVRVPSHLRQGTFLIVMAYPPIARERKLSAPTRLWRNGRLVLLLRCALLMSTEFRQNSYARSAHMDAVCEQVGNRSYRGQLTSTMWH